MQDSIIELTFLVNSQGEINHKTALKYYGYQLEAYLLGKAGKKENLTQNTARANLGEEQSNHVTLEPEVRMWPFRNSSGNWGEFHERALDIYEMIDSQRGA